MKTRLIITLILLFTAALAACQSANPTVSPTQPSSGYPIPNQETPAGGQEVYPAPQEIPTRQPDVLYPGSKDGDQVTWDQAVSMIMNGEVKQITQTHALDVTLQLKDGRTLITAEPAIDDVIQVIQRCGEACKDIVIATE